MKPEQNPEEVVTLVMTRRELRERIRRGLHACGIYHDDWDWMSNVLIRALEGGMEDGKGHNDGCRDPVPGLRDTD